MNSGRFPLRLKGFRITRPVTRSLGIIAAQKLRRKAHHTPCCVLAESRGRRALRGLALYLCSKCKCLLSCHQSRSWKFMWMEEGYGERWMHNGMQSEKTCCFLRTKQGKERICATLAETSFKPFINKCSSQNTFGWNKQLAVPQTLGFLVFDDAWIHHCTKTIRL